MQISLCNLCSWLTYNVNEPCIEEKLVKKKYVKVKNMATSNNDHPDHFVLIKKFAFYLKDSFISDDQI